MARKKKKGAPQKACVRCGKMIHARKITCDTCGATQSAAKKVVKKAKSAKKPGPRRKAAGVSVGLVDVQSAAEFISSMGGVANAKQAISTAEELARKLA